MDISGIKNPKLLELMQNRSYEIKPCNRPKRIGQYINIRAQGLSPGSSWFVGLDHTGQHIEECLGF